MTTTEWLTLIGILISGFLWISAKLEKIYVALANSVTHKQCSERRDKCPCIEDIEELKAELKGKRK